MAAFQESGWVKILILAGMEFVPDVVGAAFCADNRSEKQPYVQEE